ncbi:2-hydroxyacid dehydrogenase [Piscinibacter sakaiensis]|nr:2-hydroxyacid dehydrogenase [Piscinibacter sakaiensis]
MTERPALLQLLPLTAELDARLDATYARTLAPADPAAREALLAARGGAFQALVTSAAFGVDDGLLARLPALQVVSSFGVGLDRIDRAAAARRGVVVGYTPDVLNDCVADQAFGLLLAVARRLPAADRYVRAGRWDGPPSAGRFPLGRRVSGAKLGIVGLGRIGRTIARRAGGFDMAVRYHSRRAVPDVPWQHEPSLRALAAWCDFLVVITAGGAETRHLIDAAVLDALGPQGFLVNVARGSVVDEAALVQALADGRIAGAGLDVFEHEPQVPEALRAMDHVVLAPHTASATIETRRAMGERVADNLDAWFRERRLVSAAPAP